MDRVLRLGIDVGGTNTDAVLLSGDTVVATAKEASTADVTSGIARAVGAVVAARPGLAREVAAVMIGTTHFLNALVDGSHLAPTAVIRLGLPAAAAVPPLSGWPDRLRASVGGHVFMCHGGHEYDGRLISPFDAAEFRAAVDAAHHAGARSYAISSVFSPVAPDLELAAAQLLAEELPDAPVSLSHEIGTLGLLERENATALNAALRELAEVVTDGLVGAVRAAGVAAPIFLSSNDGALMGVEYARRFPVTTLASGPANSMRGAAVLAGRTSCTVIDVGGTTVDVGVLEQGYPREAPDDVSVALVPTNVRMPDVISLSFGGGSVVGGSADRPTLGPRSVGLRLRQDALVFGGDVLTATDIAVAAGRSDLGERGLTRGVPRSLVDAVLAQVRRSLGDAVDRMRLSVDPVTAVVVGGGGAIVADDLPDVAEVIRPEHHEVANAVGAAVARVSGEVDRVVTATGAGARDAVDAAAQEAVDRAIAAGARPSTVQVVDTVRLPLNYLPGEAYRVRVKAVGELALQDPLPEVRRG
ncbi:hydantoinase/oxoprolinase N-terminal domain-containing protein [Nocardioides nitrophenolicus]|uniref:hydantoinase/oxoprolinase N-terminal domain-containing protein n=1 Tax=Nocardioides nitrophenolicus TaxID=60489 RepID=UPI0027DC7056|nr:hydantoinase/oxoprolinase N-terminal domain-containing protein [Nocardioides nitrophenolicus]MBM7520437.1 N-methylhydantoinase A/oxoprolinase/acetone carboxylase beta subunit [Nocardioides nitrophenolicus]